MDEGLLLLQSRGFWKLLEEVQFSGEVRTLLPLATDRFLEAKHFLRLVVDLEPTEQNVERGNWYAGAHLAATIEVCDGGAADFENLSRVDFRHSRLGREFWLSPDAENPFERDSIGGNRAYRKLRNIRTHLATPVVYIG